MSYYPKKAKLSKIALSYTEIGTHH